MFRETRTVLLDTARALRYRMRGLDAGFRLLVLSGIGPLQRGFDRVTAGSRQGVLEQVAVAGRSTQGKEA
jgi:hypothetical protein